MSHFLLLGCATQQPRYAQVEGHAIPQGIDSSAPSQNFGAGHITNTLKTWCFEMCSMIEKVDYEVSCSHAASPVPVDNPKVALNHYKELFSTFLSAVIDNHHNADTFLSAEFSEIFDKMIFLGLFSDLKKIVDFSPNTLSTQYGGQTLLHMALIKVRGGTGTVVGYDYADHDTNIAKEDILDYLIEKSPSEVLSMQDHQKNTPFHLLADLTSVKAFSRLTTNKKSRAESLIPLDKDELAKFVTLENDKQRTPLHTAVLICKDVSLFDSALENNQLIVSTNQLVGLLVNSTNINEVINNLDCEQRGPLDYLVLSMNHKRLPRIHLATIRINLIELLLDKIEPLLNKKEPLLNKKYCISSRLSETQQSKIETLLQNQQALLERFKRIVSGLQALQSTGEGKAGTSHEKPRA